MKYVHVPSDLSIRELRAEGACFAPGRYIRFIPPKKTAKTEFFGLDKLVVLREERVRRNRRNRYRYAEIGDIDVATGGVTFREMHGCQVPTDRPAVAQPNDILVSTVRTYRKGIGWVTDEGDNLITTNAVLNICNVSDAVKGLTKQYVFSFLRTAFFVEQVWSMLNRGLYPRMDKGALDKISIPIPCQENVIAYVSTLVEVIIDTEQEIRKRAAAILNTIQTELEANQRKRSFQFEYPSLGDLRNLGRLDACIYDREYKSKIWLVENYRHGFSTPTENGFTVTPGPSLEIKIVRTRLDSDVPKPGFYALILPTNISVYGTMNVISYMGTGKKLPLLREGDIVFGEAGFQKGRSIVLLEGIENCTTNAHGLYARRSDGDTSKSVFFRCVFNWYRSMRLIDLMAVGGSGGHFSPEYFDYLRIPRFPEDVCEKIVALYHNPSRRPASRPTLEGFVEWHRRWNANLGIWELDREMKSLQRTLAGVQELIIEGKPVAVPF